MGKNTYTTRSIQLSTSLHFNSLKEFRMAGNGKPIAPGQTVTGIDNGYGLQGNPTLQDLQDSISDSEKGKYTLLYPSGLTALTALGGLLKSGEHWLLPDSAYAPLRRYAKYLSDRYGIEYDLYNPSSLESVKRKITKKTRLIHIENPGSVIFAVSDTNGIVKLARLKGIITSADNTWAAGKLYQPLAHGVDISILALTKYPAGYSDVFMGSITTKNEGLFKQLSYNHRVYGYTVSPFSAMLVKRGLESLSVRLATHGENARQLINAIKRNKKIAKIYYVDTNKNKLFTGINGLFSIELDREYSDNELEKPFSSLSTFALGESWGGTRSMILLYQPKECKSYSTSVYGTIIRFHAGLENLEQQIKDIKNFLRSLEIL